MFDVTLRSNKNAPILNLKVVSGMKSSWYFEVIESKQFSILYGHSK